MKKLITIAVLGCATLSLFAQGTIQMNGRSGTLVQAQVFSYVPGEGQKQGNMATNSPRGPQT